jgi:hypothetical protein
MELDPASDKEIQRGSASSLEGFRAGGRRFKETVSPGQKRQDPVLLTNIGS